uniref:Putative monooxygenase p33MONOX n=1 Tax=Knipowitschia caucasica TaxID=637954 RepID=A0AAV2JG98_KNICA
MSTPPHDISINNLWRRPVIPDRRFTQLTEEDESKAAIRSAVSSAPNRPPPVVKTKASSSIMNSIITKHTHDSMSKFEQRAGLSDTGYTPHKGLTADETRHHHRLPESLQKLQIQTLENRDEKQPSSAQSTPSTTPHSSPRHQRRGWFQSVGSEASLTSSSSSSVDLSSGDSAVERWGVFGPRPVVHKSTSDVGAAAEATADFVRFNIVLEQFGEKEVSQEEVGEEKEVSQEEVGEEKEVSQEEVGEEKEVSQEEVGEEKEVSQEEVGEEKEVSQEEVGEEKEVSQEEVGGGGRRYHRRRWGRRRRYHRRRGGEGGITEDGRRRYHRRRWGRRRYHRRRWGEKEVSQEEVGEEKEVSQEEVGEEKEEEVGEEKEVSQEEVGEKEVSQEEVGEEKEVSQEEVGEEKEVSQEEVGEKEVSQEEVGEKEVSQEEVGEKEVSQEEVGEKEVSQEEVGEEKEVSQEEVGEKEVSQEEVGEEKEVSQEEVGEDDESLSFNPSLSFFPAGFALQSYRGAQKPSPMEVMKSQATRLADPTPQQLNPPKLEIPTVDPRKQGSRPHKLKHRDMNILTPSGF